MPVSGRLHRAVTRRIGKMVHPLWPGEIRAPIFVVGCPRSGTSVFGRILGHYPGFLYMHEPRYLWRHINPDLNIWQGHPVRGRLCWAASDAEPNERQRLARWFHLALTLSGQHQLVEKLPLNVFRIGWLATMFPEARFIHLIRHGRDVALSMEEAVQRWFGEQEGYRARFWQTSWHYLMFEEYAERVPQLRQKLPRVRQFEDNYARCLFVWLCSVWAGRNAGQAMGRDSYLEIRYRDLVQCPQRELTRVFAFLDEALDQGTIDHARQVLHGSSIQKPDPCPKATRTIAGDMLGMLGFDAI